MANKETFCGASSIHPRSQLRRVCGDKHKELGVYQCVKCARVDHAENVRIDAQRYQFLRACAMRPEFEEHLNKRADMVNLTDGNKEAFDKFIDGCVKDAIAKGWTF